MLDVTSYADKLPPSLNAVLKSFTGGECVMVRKAKEKEKLTGKAGHCHHNVKTVVNKFGGTSVSGWLLNRLPQMMERGMYIWSFHSVWMKPDGKLLDVTEDKHYVGRDKSIFVPDTSRAPDLVEGISYNNFVVFTEPAFAQHYANSIGVEIRTNTPYWSDNTILRLLGTDEHSGAYRLVLSNDSPNFKRMCDEYEIDFVDGRPVPRPGSKYENAPMPIRLLFDYSVSAGR
jgi:hypothetical protein